MKSKCKFCGLELTMAEKELHHCQPPEGSSAPSCSPYEIPVIDYTEMNQRTRLEWEVKAAYNRPNAPELPQDFIDYVVDRILEIKEENGGDHE